MKKKAMVLLLTASMVISLLSGCGIGAIGKEDVTIIVKCPPYNIIQDMEAGQDKAYRLAIQHIDQTKRKSGSYQTKNDSFNGERCADKIVGGADQLHNGDLIAPHGNTNGYRIADQENRYCQKNDNNGGRHITQKFVKST